MKSIHLLFLLFVMAASANESKEHLPGKALSRGERGFHLGDTLDQLDKRANELGLTLSSPGVDLASGQAGGSRYYRSREKSEVRAFTMFIKKGRAETVDLIFSDNPSDQPDFSSLLESFEEKFGKPDKLNEARRAFPRRANNPAGYVYSVEHLHLQDAFWCDGRTIIQIESRIHDDKRRELQVKYLNLPSQTRISFGLIGATGRGYSCTGRISR